MTLEELEKTVQREQPDLSTTIAADGTVTIAFTDIVDSTVMIGRLGDQAWLDVIDGTTASLNRPPRHMAGLWLRLRATDRCSLSPARAAQSHAR